MYNFAAGQKEAFPLAGWWLSDVGNRANDSGPVYGEENQKLSNWKDSGVEQLRNAGVVWKNMAAISHSVSSSDEFLAFLRCSAFSLRPQASSTHAEKLAPGLSGFSRSTLASISSSSSCGNRMPLYEDLLFLCPVAIVSTYVMSISCDNTGRIKTSEVFKHKLIDVFKHHEIRYLNTLSTDKAQQTHKIATPQSAVTLPRRLTTNDRRSIEVAMSNHTTPIAGRNTHIQQHAQSHQRFVFIFAAIRRNSTEIAPEMRHVSAFSEREARKALASDFILLFAGRLPIHAQNQSASNPAMSTRIEAERDDQ